MNYYLKVLISSFLAGMLISFGGLIFLSVRHISIIAGGFLFAFGLFCVIVFKLHLFTGKIGYLIDNKIKYVVELLVILLGNFIGAILIGLLAKLVCPNLLPLVTEIANNKLSNNLLSCFILSFFCGIMIFIAVEVSKKDVSPAYKVIAIFFAVALFVIMGFEHCVANMFYFTFASAFSLKMLLYLLIMIIGNTLGSISFYGLLKLINKK